MQIGWEGLMKMALLERFGQYGWVHEWSPDHPFDNIFLVRKPRMATSVIETRGDQELGILPGQKTRLDQLRTTFLQDPNVRKHISQPDMAWDAMLALNDGGVSRLAARLEEVAPLELKLARIGEQLKAIVSETFEHRLGRYYRQEGAAEVDHKKRIAEAVINALRHRPDRFGELLHALQPAGDHLRSLYLRAEEEPVKKRDDGEADRPDTGTSGLIDLDFGDFDLATSDGEKPAVSGSATRFVQAAMGDWISQLKGLPGQTNLARFLGVPRGALENLVDELITAADRLDLEGSLLAAIQEAEERTSATRVRLVERQVFALRTRVCEFVDRLGYGETPPAERPPSPVAEGRRIFQAPPTIAPGGLPELAPRPVNFSGMYIVDWFEAFKRLTVANAGHDSGREISPEDNEWLGRILAHVKGVDGGVSLAKSR
jgi:hypothetical protein